MRILKLVLISIVILFAVLTGLASLLPSHVRISRAVDVMAPRRAIYPLVTTTRAWESWNELIRADAQRQWTGDTLKTQGMTIVPLQTTDSLVTAEWVQASGNRFTSGYQLIPDPRDSMRTVFQWYFDFHVRWYPWEKFQSVVYDAQLGPGMEKSLQNLKRQVEHP